MKELLQQALDALESCEVFEGSSEWERNFDQDKVAEAIKVFKQALAQQEQPASVDAYVGAREDAAIWKKRALEAEELNRKFIAEVNGPTYLGEPAQQEHPAQEPVGKFLKATYGDYAVLNWHPSYVAKIGDCLYARPAPTQPSLSESDIGKACEAVSVALGSAYDCGRVWAAWSCGTMTEDDFSLVSEDPERVREIAISAIEAHCRGGANHG